MYNTSADDSDQPTTNKIFAMIKQKCTFEQDNAKSKQIHVCHAVSNDMHVYIIIETYT
jgi:hypothetical protein